MGKGKYNRKPWYSELTVHTHWSMGRLSAHYAVPRLGRWTRRDARDHNSARAYPRNATMNFGETHVHDYNSASMSDDRDDELRRDARTRSPICSSTFRRTAAINSGEMHVHDYISARVYPTTATINSGKTHVHDHQSARVPFEDRGQFYFSRPWSHVAA
jgi:hypothetical protein